MTVHPTKFGFTLPQRGVFIGVTTMDRMMALAAEVDANLAAAAAKKKPAVESKATPSANT